jgi:ribonuclease J
MMGSFLMTGTTGLTFLNLGRPTGLKFVVEHGSARAMFEMGVEHAPGAVPFSLGLHPRPGRELPDLQAVGMAPRMTGVLGSWDRRTALFLSHMHLDHAALAAWVHPEVPLYYPQRMEPLREACVRAGYVQWRDPPGTPVPDRGKVPVGDIEVEFVAVDHDLPGATGFLVRTPDLAVAYTGDHRWHGFHPEVTERFAEAARGIQVLLQEAASLGWGLPVEVAAGRAPGAVPGVAGGTVPGVAPAVAHDLDRSEEDVIRGFGDVLDCASGLVVVNLYPMNRLRVHALGAACAARGRVLVLEREAAVMADWPLVLEDVGAVLHDPRRYCVQLGFGSLPTLIDLRPPAGSIYVHSNGVPLGPYDPTYQVMLAWVRALGLELVTLGSTGHSRWADVQRMVEAVGPRVVLPVHSRRPEALLVPGVPTLIPEAGRRYTVEDLVPPP